MGWVKDNILGGNQAAAAENGADVQAAAAQQGVDLQRETRDIVRGDQQPFRDLGVSNITALQNAANQSVETPNINVTKYLDKPIYVNPNNAFNNSDPQYQFLVNEQNKAINESAAAKGKLNSGGTLAEIARQTAGTAAQYSNNRFNQLMALRQNNFSENMQNAGLASTLRDQILRERLSVQNNKYNQLRDLVGIGQNAAANQGSTSMNSANAISQLLGEKANAFAAGQMGAANAKTGAVNNLIQLGTTAAMIGAMSGGGGAPSRGISYNQWANSGYAGN